MLVSHWHTIVVCLTSQLYCSYHFIHCTHICDSKTLAGSLEAIPSYLFVTAYIGAYVLVFTKPKKKNTLIILGPSFWCNRFDAFLYACIHESNYIDELLSIISLCSQYCNRNISKMCIIFFIIVSPYIFLQ